jgi:plastocyanin
MVRLRELVEKGSPTMRRGSAAVIACCALLLAAGCGSSSNSTAGSTTTATSTTSSSPAASLKVDETPKYAAPPTSPAQSGLVQIAYRNITIAPDAIKVKVGSTIRWTNYDSVEHDVTSEGGPQTFASKTFGEGGTFEIKANKPGVIHYECTIHPTTMNGTIDVVK